MKRIQFKNKQEAHEQKWVDARLEVKAEGLAEGVLLHLKAYALAFGNVDSWGDIVLPGACDDFLKSEDAGRMALCWQHDIRTVIGKITAKGVDDYGMWIEADVLDTAAGRDAAVLLKAGAVKEFSIGYRADKYRWEKREGYDYDIRILEVLTVYECSPVTRAANASAIVISAKAFEHDSPESAPKADEDPKNDTTINNNKSHSQMTPEEIKAMRESIEKAASEKVQAEVAEKVKELKAAQEKIEAQEKSIDNLDKSLVGQQKIIDEMKAQLADRSIKTFAQDLRAKLEEKKADLQKMFDEKVKAFDITLEFKTVYDISTGSHTINPNNFLGLAVDPTIHAARPAANVFLEAFGIRPRTANKLAWIESSEQNGADYVTELAQNTNKSDVSFTEKTRKFGKLAHTMRISTEFTDWFEQLYNYCLNEGQRMILAKLDSEAYAGLGNDTPDAGTGASPDKIYGIKHYATAFSALGSYPQANIADVIYDAMMQIAKKGFHASAVFVTWAEYAILMNLKDKNGNALFDRANQMVMGLRVYPTAVLAADEILVADTGCAEIYAGNSFELEFIRNGVYDAYDVYFRRAAQVKITTPGAYGLVYVADVDTAIAAIDAGEGTLGDVVTKLGAIKDELSTIKTNTGNIKDYTTAVGAINTAITKLAGAVNESDQIETHPNTQA